MGVQKLTAELFEEWWRDCKKDVNWAKGKMLKDMLEEAFLAGVMAERSRHKENQEDGHGVHGVSEE